MDGPGQYEPGNCPGVTSIDDLPKPKILRRSQNYRGLPCPECGHRASRVTTVQRTLHDLGDPRSGRPCDILFTYSQHRCGQCNAYCSANNDALALPNSHYTHRVVQMAVRLVVEDGLPYRAASWHLWRDHRVFVPWSTIRNWVEATGKKSGTKH